MNLKSKERIKKGELLPEEAIEILTRDPLCPAGILKWISNAGIRRYNQAQDKKVEALIEEKKNADTEDVD